MTTLIKLFLTTYIRENWACGTGGLGRATRVWSGNMEVVFVPAAQNGLEMKLVRLCWGCQGDLDPAGEPALCSCWAGQVVNSQTSQIS